ncbi:MAG: bifunctional 4-hydroxy-2-oxoglutarate aldolase/2-dehydro-3-deoxy-phosphogluconate aldolase [Chloroflexota bacterium]
MLIQTESMQRTIERISQMGIIGIVRGDFPLADIIEMGDALLAAPVLVMEVTMNTTGALDAISTLRARYGDNMLVGAGTVRTAAQVDAAVDAGAQFIVSPNFDRASVRKSQQRNVAHLPGVFTGTEAQDAFAAGCPLVKLFPADFFGPPYIKALRAPLDDIGFVPTGGINVDNIGEYAKVGAVAVGVGSSLIPKPGQAWSNADIITKARALRSAWESGKVG